MRFYILLLLILIITTETHSQDTLPSFSVVNVGNFKVRISWVNPYGERLTQLNVQRSYDSLKNFKTIFLSPSPQLPQNGIVDAQAYGSPIFYKIFYVLDGEKYLFTVSKRPSAYNPKTEVKNNNEPTTNINKPKNNIPANPTPNPVTPVKPKQPDSVQNNKPAKPIRIIYVIKNDSLIAKLSWENFIRFRDSIALRTKDTLTATDAETVVLKPFKPKEIWKASTFVYTNKQGYVDIRLPLAGHKKYRLIIRNENGEELFHLKNIHDTLLTLDKANFIHAGWFYFELFEDEHLKERNKFYIWKDF